MAAIAWSDVEGLDATLETVDPAVQTVILGRVEQLSAKFFGGVDNPKYKLARMLLAAHLGTPYVNGGTGGTAAAGPVTSESEGGVSRSYGFISGALAGAHSTTSHGRLFDELVRSSPYRVGVTT